MNDLHLLAINLTYRCNLRCAHCYMDAGGRAEGRDDELGSEEVEQLLDQLAAKSPETMVVLTGGEPLLRHDIERLVAHGSRLGLMMVLGSNGLLLDDRRVVTLKQAGLLGVGLSLDSLDPERHDRFRGAPGSWERTLAAMDSCRRHGLPFQVHFSVTNETATELAAMAAFTQSVGAHLLNIFFLVCTGRGESMSDISPAAYEQTLQQIVALQPRYPELLIRARCAPHFKRLLHQNDPASPLTSASGYEAGGCPAGVHYARVTPQGELTACPYIPDSEGSLRTTPLWTLWQGSPRLQALRAPQLQGKCGRCEYRRLCGGCRARPLALARAASPETLPPDEPLLMASDPWCLYQPGEREVIAPLIEGESPSIRWTGEAEARLQRVPPFVRRMVRRRAEAHALEQGEAQVTAAHLETLARRRFGGGMPQRPTVTIDPGEEPSTPSPAAKRP